MYNKGNYGSLPNRWRLSIGKENNMRLKKGLSALCICLILAMTACDTAVPPADTDAPTESATETPSTPEDTTTETETETEGETSPEVSAPLDGMDYRVSEHADAVDAAEAGYTDRVLHLDTPGLAVNLGKLDLSVAGKATYSPQSELQLEEWMVLPQTTG